MDLHSVPPDENEQRRDPTRDERDKWLDVAEDEQIAEGNISVSDTVDGSNPTPDLDDEGAFEEFDRIIDEEDL